MKLDEALVAKLIDAGLDEPKAREIAAIEAGGHGCTDPEEAERSSRED